MEQPYLNEEGSKEFAENICRYIEGLERPYNWKEKSAHIARSFIYSAIDKMDSVRTHPELDSSIYNTANLHYEAGNDVFQMTIESSSRNHYADTIAFATLS